MVSIQSAVLLCTFNRPDLAQRVLRQIGQWRPSQLLVVGDGPRAGSARDVELVKQTRRLFARLDWKCELITSFSDQHLGCRQRMLSGISWAFEHCQRLVIVEDDCLPAMEFFPFCDGLLERFEDDGRIMMISGNNFQPAARSPHSYYFSKWPHIWGWATWKRAWKLCDGEMSAWPSARRDGLCERTADTSEEAVYFRELFDRQYRGEIDTWDNAWAFSCWLHDGLSVLPQVNLVSNLGFRPDATHTVDPQSKLARMPVGTLGPWDHPPVVIRDIEADRNTWTNVFADGLSEMRRQWSPARFSTVFRRRRAA